jgi:hypothetical protein
VRKRVREALRADVRAVVVDQLIPTATRVATVAPPPPTPLADPPAGRGELAPDGRQVNGAQPGQVPDHGVLVGQWNEEAALLDSDPRGRWQTSGHDSADVGDQVRAVGDVAQPGLAVA